MRKLYVVRMIHDIFRESIYCSPREFVARNFGPNPDDEAMQIKEDYIAAEDQFWNLAVDMLASRVNRDVKIFQDSLTDGKDLKKQLSDWRASESRNFGTICDLVDNGGQLIHTEDNDAWDRGAIFGKMFSTLERDIEIARRIDEGMQDGDQGVLFIGNSHEVETALKVRESNIQIETLALDLSGIASVNRRLIEKATQYHRSLGMHPEGFRNSASVFFSPVLSSMRMDPSQEMEGFEFSSMGLQNGLKYLYVKRTTGVDGKYQVDIDLGGGFKATKFEIREVNGRDETKVTVEKRYEVDGTEVYMKFDVVPQHVDYEGVRHIFTEFYVGDREEDAMVRDFSITSVHQNAVDIVDGGAVDMPFEMYTIAGKEYGGDSINVILANGSIGMNGVGSTVDRYTEGDVHRYESETAEARQAFKELFGAIPRGAIGEGLEGVKINPGLFLTTLIGAGYANQDPREKIVQFFTEHDHSV